MKTLKEEGVEAVGGGFHSQIHVGKPPLLLFLLTMPFIFKSIIQFIKSQVVMKNIKLSECFQ